MSLDCHKAHSPVFLYRLLLSKRCVCSGTYLKVAKIISFLFLKLLEQSQQLFLQQSSLLTVNDEAQSHRENASLEDMKKVHRKCSGGMSAEGLRSHRKIWYEGLIHAKSSTLWSGSQTAITYWRSLHVSFFMWSHCSLQWDAQQGWLSGHIVTLGENWEDQTQVKAPSFWWSSCCLPRLQPGEERLCSNQRRGSCSEFSCPRGLTPSGPREHLSLSLNWGRNLIKTLFQDEGMMGIGHAHHPEEEE